VTGCFGKGCEPGLLSWEGVAGPMLESGPLAGVPGTVKDRCLHVQGRLIEAPDQLLTCSVCAHPGCWHASQCAQVASGRHGPGMAVAATLVGVAAFVQG